MPDPIDIEAIRAILHTYTADRCGLDAVAAVVDFSDGDDDDDDLGPLFQPCQRHGGHDGTCDVCRRLMGWPGTGVLSGLCDEIEHLRSELAEKSAESDRLADELVVALDSERRLRAEHVKFAAHIVRRAPPLPDWACRWCRPNSDMLADGFTCVYHDAAAILERETDTGATTE